MALIIKDRVKETTTTTGTGTVTLAGASTGFRSFADIGNANTTYYTIAGGSEWEVGLGTYTASGTTLSRDTVLSNSLGTTAKISFSAGSKDVFCTYPSGVAVANTSIVTPYITSGNINNVGIGNNSLNTIGAGVATVTQLTAGSGYDSGYDGSGAALVYVSGTPIIAGGTAPIVTVFINGDGTINSVSIQSVGFGWTALDTVFTLNNADLGGVGSGATFRIASLTSAVNNTAIGYGAGGTQKVGSNSVHVGYNTSGTGSNQVLIGSNITGITQDNVVVIGDTNITNTTLRGNVTATTFTGIGSFTNLTAGGTLQLTGNLTGTHNLVTSQTSGTLTIGGATATGSLTLGRSTSSQTVNIATGANTTGTKTLNLGTNGGAGGTTTIAIGTTAGTSTTTLNGAVTLSATTQAIDIGTTQSTGAIAIGGTSATSALTLGQSTGAQNINISNGAASTSIVNIGGTGASTGNINIGRSTGTQTISIGSGGTGSTVTGTATRTINIGTSSLGTGISNINIGKYSTSVNHTTYITGRTVILTAETLTFNNFGALSIGANLAQTTMFVADLGSLTGVVKGSRSFVTDNLVTPVFNAIVTDGDGSGFATPIFYDGTNWRCG